MSVAFVITEHSGALPPARLAHYEEVRGRLERLAGLRVATLQYEGVESLGGADAVVLSGSFAPWAEHSPEALDRLGCAMLAYDGPVLGICAGMQLQARFGGGTTRQSPSGGEKGYSAVEIVEPDGLLEGLPARIDVYQHHADEIAELPDDFRVLARSPACAVEAIAHRDRRWWGTQFHPEEFDDGHRAGERILHNFFGLALS